ncbi:MAG: TRAP transporter permease [bacterium]|jgi:TRAP transporter 4TM/12TM fusion protein|nr:TRAP transporter permease [Spirochaetales bacterium]MDT3389607.1 TRAP transporter permease [bacterium]
MRTYTGKTKTAITVLMVLWVVFQLWFTTFGIIPAVNLRAIHCMFLLMFTFLLYPAARKGKNETLSHPRITDMILIAVALCAFGYMVLKYTDVARSGGRIDTFQMCVAAVGIIMVFEAGRRVSRNLAVLAAIFLAYNFLGKYIPGYLGHNGFTLKRILITQFWGTQGILGTGAGVSATYVFLFVVFGAFLKHSGFSEFINNLALTLVGRSPGGPAKVAVMASALLGMANGSAVANVATTGTITIPMMKRSGYRNEFAAAVEATASTGGQFCPPVMGAAGFIMAEFLNVRYGTVIVAAIVPAALYYLGIMLSVHFEAKRLGLSGVPESEIPDAKEVLKNGWHLAIPLVVLITVMILGRSPLYAAAVSIPVTVAASWIRKDTRMTWDRIIAACVDGAKGAVTVGISCILIGIIIGTVTLTSLGLNIGYMILNGLAGSNIYLVGILVMVISVILGMGVPGVAAYVIVQAVAVPVLLKAGAVPLAAHMFCLIYACLSNITPPVAISCYVAAGIAEANQTKTGLTAVKLALAGFIVPLFFLANPVLLPGAQAAGTASTALQTILAALTAAAGTVMLSGGLEGWFIIRQHWVERILFISSALLLLFPGTRTDIIGLGMAILLIAEQAYRAYGNKNRNAVM